MAVNADREEVKLMISSIEPPMVTLYGLMFCVELIELDRLGYAVV